MVIPSKLKLLSVHGPAVSKKNGMQYMFAEAESPADPELCVFSTIRWRCVRQCSQFPATWKQGAEVPVAVMTFDARSGEGQFDVPAASR